jgi:hypothetical protein
MAIVWLEGLGKLKNINDLIVTQTYYLLACSIVPQLIMPPSPPNKFMSIQILNSCLNLRRYRFIY